MEILKKNSHFCVLPWTQLTVNPNGTINPCCSTTDVFNLGNIKETSLREAWNNEGLKTIRKEILENKLPDACQNCFKREKFGIESVRQRVNKFYGHFAIEADKTQPDGSLLTMNLRSLDLRFSNHCNLSCRICRPIASTGWYTDAKLLGYKHMDLTKKITPTPGNVKLMEEVLPLLKNLERIFFVGGEPLLQKEHFQVLDELLLIGNDRIQLDYITNFTKLKFGSFSTLAYWKKFKKVSVTISLDAMGKRVELLRKGLNWNSFLSNLESVRSETPQVTLFVSPTVSLHNVFHLPEFVLYLIKELKFSAADINLTLLTEPSYYSVQALPIEEKENVVKAFGQFFKNITAHLDQDSSQLIISQFQGVIDYMHEQDLSGKFPYFISMTKRLDFIRGENFTEAFPEFAKYSQK